MQVRVVFHHKLIPKNIVCLGLPIPCLFQSPMKFSQLAWIQIATPRSRHLEAMLLHCRKMVIGQQCAYGAVYYVDLNWRVALQLSPLANHLTSNKHERLLSLPMKMATIITTFGLFDCIVGRYKLLTASLSLIPLWDNWRGETFEERRFINLSGSSLSLFDVSYIRFFTGRLHMGNRLE